jgi:SAM-dependent methyltransferase
MTEREIAEWHADENEWWEKYADIMSRQWELDDYSNKVLRKNIQTESFKHLVKEDGNLLDLGCGNGWLSFKFNAAGMRTLGIDFSQKQIELANNSKASHGISNASFLCSDILSWDYSNYLDSFDSIHINAFLHHLPSEELDELFRIISKVSKNKASLYLYEPIYFPNMRVSVWKKPLLFFITKFFGLLAFRLPLLLNFWSEDFKRAKKDGYTGTSPHEAGIDYTFFRSILDKYSFKVESMTPTHYKSIVYALLVNSMKPSIKKILIKGLPAMVKMDHFLFSFFGWKNIGKKNDFLLYSIKIRKD